MEDDFDAWFRREAAPFEGAIRSRLSRLLASHADVEDALWLAYERLFTSGAWRSAERPAELIHRMARNIAIDQLRRQKVVSFETASDAVVNAVDDAPGPEERLDDSRAIRVLKVAIEQLPAQCRRVFVMRRVQGLSPLEIVELTGLSVSTIEKHVAKGLRYCAERLAEAGLERTASKAWMRRARTARP